MYDLIIIGAGPAGLSAAIYASRSNLKILILDGGAPGGKLNVTAEIENYPGNKNITGPDLAYGMFEHATHFGAEYEYGLVESIHLKEDHKEVVTNEQVYSTKAILIATGTKERRMNIPNENEMIGRGVSYCAVCDGAFFTDEEVAVIGGGNSALEEAMYLTKFAKKVHLVVRSNQFRADQIIQDALEKNEKIEVHFQQKPLEVIVEDNKVAGLLLENTITNEHSNLLVKGIFPFIGLDPVTDFLKPFDILDTQGYIVTDENMRTSVEGIYAAGDVRQKFLRQVVTATNDGAIAAQTISHDFQNRNSHK